MLEYIDNYRIVSKNNLPKISDYLHKGKTYCNKNYVCISTELIKANNSYYFYKCRYKELPQNDDIAEWLELDACYYLYAVKHKNIYKQYNKP